MGTLWSNRRHLDSTSTNRPAKKRQNNRTPRLVAWLPPAASRRNGRPRNGRYGTGDPDPRVGERGTYPLLLLGGSEDRQLIKDMVSGLERCNVWHWISTDIKLSAALIHSARLCLCHDSAARQLAAALGTKSFAFLPGPAVPVRPPETEGCLSLTHETSAVHAALLFS
jgi:hypothetical protein